MLERMDFISAAPDEAYASGDRRLVDLLDGLLSHGVVLRGEAWISVADVDLVFLGLDLIVASPDIVRPAGKDLG